MQLVRLRLQLRRLQLDPLPAGRDVGDAPPHLLEQLQLLLVRVVKGFARIFSLVQRRVGLGPEDRRHPLEDAHRYPYPFCAGVRTRRACHPPYVPAGHQTIGMPAPIKWGHRRGPPRVRSCIGPAPVEPASSVNEVEPPVFRRTKSEPAPVPPSRKPKPGGKGRPTPSRKEAEAARKARSASRATARRRRRYSGRRLRAERGKMQDAMRTGDDRYLPPADKGPARRFARDYVDARYSVMEFALPVLLVVAFGGILLTPRWPLHRAAGEPALPGHDPGDRIDWFLLTRGLKSKLTQRQSRSERPAASASTRCAGPCRCAAGGCPSRWSSAAPSSDAALALRQTGPGQPPLVAATSSSRNFASPIHGSTCLPRCANSCGWSR